MMKLTLEVLHVPDCPTLATMLRRLRQVTDLPITTREIATETDASESGMTGSPTLLINGNDPFRAPNQPDGALACRIYRDEHGNPAPAPSAAQLRDALAAAGAAAPVTPPTTGPAAPSDVLSSWASRALPLDRDEKAVHQAILRRFATTGHPPPAAELPCVPTCAPSAEAFGSWRTSATGSTD